MKIDIYARGDPRDEQTWSGIPRETANTFERLGVMGNAYNVVPFDNHFLTHLPYYRFGADTDENSTTGLGSIRNQHPHFRRCIERKTEKVYRENPKPDAILMTGDGDFARIERTPYFVYTDVTMQSILDFRSEMGTTYLFDQYSDSLLRKRRPFESEVYRNAAGVFVASDWIADSVREAVVDDPETVHSVGFGHRYSIADVDETVIDGRFEDPEVLFVGRDGQRKGIDLLIDAYRQLDEETLKLTLVTDVSELSRGLIRFCERDPNVELHDSIFGDELSLLYERASAFVMPSRFEPWGKVFFEAMSFGLPIVGADRCAMPEFIRDGYNGFVSSLAPSAIAERILTVHSDRDAYARLSRNALTIAERYTWENVLREVATVIRDSVESRPDSVSNTV